MLHSSLAGINDTMNRRHFLRSIAALAAPSGLAGCAARLDPQRLQLRADPAQILDIAEGFTYTVVSRAGDMMSDGLKVPGAHDGMGAFAGEKGRVVLICNHELLPSQRDQSAFADGFEQLPAGLTERFYDRGGSRTPGCGATTTTIYDPARRATERQYLSLAGTELNCAGGATPWGSWLSCEECFESPGIGLTLSGFATRDQRHGYVYEIPAAAQGLVEPRPLRSMGRFEHEAAAVHPESGIVYMTEDRHHGLFYRYLPDIPGRLDAGGRLQALSLPSLRSPMTHNWGYRHDVAAGARVVARWIDLDDVDPVDNDLRLRGAALGAATFARGEGLCIAGGDAVFTCTIGGQERLGQVFRYRPSPHEGTARERRMPGNLTLLAEAGADSLLRHADNLTFAPWGDLIICEDNEVRCGLVGLRPNGSQYLIAKNNYSNSELAGVCFSPDAKTLFVNIQYPGMTLAITGPWPA